MVKKFLISVFIFVSFISYSQIEQDKILDFGVSYGTSTLTYLICKDKGYKHPVLISMCTGTILGLTKGLYDNYTTGRNFDGTNLLAYSMGSTTACLVLKFELKEKIRYRIFL